MKANRLNIPRQALRQIIRTKVGTRNKNKDTEQRHFLSQKFTINSEYCEQHTAERKLQSLLSNLSEIIRTLKRTPFVERKTYYHQ